MLLMMRVSVPGVSPHVVNTNQLMSRCLLIHVWGGRYCPRSDSTMMALQVYNSDVRLQ